MPRAAAASHIPVRRLRVLPKSLPAISASTCPLAARTRPSPRLPAVARGARAVSIDKRNPCSRGSARGQCQAGCLASTVCGMDAAVEPTGRGGFTRGTASRRRAPESTISGGAPEGIYGVSEPESQPCTGRGQNPRHPGGDHPSACERSARMSSTCSMPTQSRIIPGVTPARACSSGVIWRCVVEAGWQASDLASPMFTSRLNSCSRVVEAHGLVHTPLDLEGEQRGRQPARAVLLRQRVVGMLAAGPA